MFDGADNDEKQTNNHFALSSSDNHGDGNNPSEIFYIVVFLNVMTYRSSNVTTIIVTKFSNDLLTYNVFVLNFLKISKVCFRLISRFYFICLL